MTKRNRCGVNSRSRVPRSVLVLETVGWNGYGWKECSIGIPGTCLSPILGLQPSKTKPFPIKTGVIWVPGQCISISHLKSLQSMKRNTKKQQITA